MLRYLALFLSLLFLVSCGPKYGQRPSRPPLKSIAVLPFEAACPGGERGYFVCPVKGPLKGVIQPEARKTMDQLLREELAGKPGFRFVPVEEFETLWAEALAQAQNPTTSEIVKALGQELRVEGLLYGKIFRFKERQGGALGVRAPASVAFALVLFRTQDGAIVWKGWFDETQKPLSENIFKFRLYRGFRWLTARELAAKGLEQVLADFPFPGDS